MIKTVGISSPGEMGHAVAKVLIDRGMPVIACLAGRSERSRQRANVAGIEAVPTLAGVAQRADLFLSILPPEHASAMARQIAATGESLTYVDCNAISPNTAIAIGDLAAAAGLTFVDAGIIGPPPLKAGITRFYASSEHVDEFAALSQYGLDIRVVGSENRPGFRLQDVLRIADQGALCHLHRVPSGGPALVAFTTCSSKSCSRVRQLPTPTSRKWFRAFL